jgi:hypothetical protein
VSWESAFSEPIVLQDGTIVATIDDARAFLIALPERYRKSPHWPHVRELLGAAESEPSARIAVLHRQLILALKAEGLIK